MKGNGLILTQFALDADLLVKKLERISADFRKDSREIMSKASEPLIVDIKRRAPVKTGRLKIAIKDLKLRRKKNGIVVGVKLTKGMDKNDPRNPWYASWVEFGTKKMPPHPFVRPAVQATGFQVLRIAESLIRMRIKMYDRGIKPSGI
ncbi:MAG TPA: HK97 gp10 family phage protein [bacterium]|nr:HK97 gp10 family phage protein [bacterium]HNH33811.1 HK97 gp10 family phage protein [bacterium]